METQQFKTNIKCTGCLSVVAPVLNEKLGEGNWQVNLDDANKTLSVSKDVDPNDLVTAIEGAGYQAEKLQES
jgi:copper chaperone CopZ